MFQTEIMPVVHRYVKGPMWVHFLVGTPPVIVFSSVCAGLAGGAVPALAQLVSSSYHAAQSSPPLDDDKIQNFSAPLYNFTSPQLLPVEVIGNMLSHLKAARDVTSGLQSLSILMEDIDEFSAFAVIARLMYTRIEALELVNLEIAMSDAQVTVELSSSTLKSVYVKFEQVYIGG
ncbi:hypothetical protein TSUD_128060 [Trifolium subterraneum]|nr:hypothetical protein TSUD_128060 [Trifolium subterraneum]